MKFCKVFIFTVLCGAVSNAAYAQLDTTQKTVPHRVNSAAQQSKPYVILISVDGFRYDFLKKHHARNMIRLSRQGVAAEYMLSSYPSLTFPNHYSMVTGLYPAHHGLVDNSFYDNRRKEVYDMHNTRMVLDSSWYAGTPLWVLAEKQNMVTASFYWVASDVAIQGVLPTHYFRFNDSISMDRRIKVVKNWWQLPEDKRPHLITFYMPQVDHEGHEHGPDSREAEKAVQLIDESIGRLSSIADSLKLPVNFIVVSDHGMASIDMKKTIAVPVVLLDSSVCRLIAGSTLMHVYVKDPGKILPLYHELQKQTGECDVYLPQDLPAAWHYGKPDDWHDRVGDMVLVARFPKVFQVGNRRLTPGKHGYDPAIKEMHATFLAWGPQIKTLPTFPPFENVNVFPLITEILGLTYSFPVDGDVKVVKGMLR